MRQIFIFMLTIVFLSSCAQTAFSIKNSYYKKEYQIPMRDGKKLFTAVYIPKDSSKNYPILLNRTPYRVAPYGEDQFKNKIGPSSLFAKEGFIFAYQDVRGRFMSEGDYVNVRPYLPQKEDSSQIDESSDAFDTIDWLVTHIPHNNGRVGMWGISYPGFYAAMGMLDAHPALKAVSPQAPIADWFIGDDMHHNGALSLAMSFKFFSVFGKPRPKRTTEWPESFDPGTPDGYRFFLKMGALPNANKKYFKHGIPFWDEVSQHPNYDDFWQKRTILPHIKNIKPAVLTVGGWFDAEDLYGPLHIFKQIEKNSPEAHSFLIMGPWSHGAWARTSGESLGDIRFGGKTSAYFQEQVELPFFNYWLKDQAKPALKKITAFDTGNLRWNTYSNWPPERAEETAVFLSDSSALSFNEPNANGFDSYISDPAHPVPFINKIVYGWDRTYMTADQRFASSRPDVLAYQSSPLDSSITIAGPLQAKLFVSSSGSDADWIVKLIDVYPDTCTQQPAQKNGPPLAGYQQLVRAEIMRSKFRNSYEKPQALIPNKVTKITVPMQDVLHTFKAGHRMMIQIQSSWFPLFDRNPQQFTDIYSAKDKDFKKAELKVYHSQKYPSRLLFGRLTGSGKKKL